MVEAWVEAKVRARLEAARIERWNIWHLAALSGIATLSGPKRLPPLKDFLGPAPGKAGKPARETRAQTPDELLSVARQWAARGVGSLTRH